MLSEIQNSLKFTLGREQSFDKGFRVQFSIFSEIRKVLKIYLGFSNKMANLIKITTRCLLLVDRGHWGFGPRKLPGFLKLSRI